MWHKTIVQPYRYTEESCISGIFIIRMKETAQSSYSQDNKIVYMECYFVKERIGKFTRGH